MGICFHNAGKCNVVTGTNFDEEGPFNQGVLNRLGTRSEKNRITWDKFPSGGPPPPSLGIFTFFYRFFHFISPRI